jgi:hypothetical protein
MANLIEPTITGSFDGEMIWDMTSITIPSSHKRYVDSIEIVHANKYINKLTGFETVKHMIHEADDEALINIAVNFVGDMPRWMFRRLFTLAHGVLSAGMEIYFRDDIVSDYKYTCRWENASNFSESSTLMGNASMSLRAWDRTSI